MAFFSLQKNGKGGNTAFPRKTENNHLKSGGIVMNGQNGNPGKDGTFNIFGNDPVDLGSAPLPDPFAAKDSTQLPGESLIQSEAPQATPVFAENTAPQVPASPVQQATPAQTAPAQQAAPVQSAPQTPAGDAKDDGEPENLLSAAVAQAEAKQAAVTADALFSKAPVFEYAAATEEIGDTSITFEQLRIEKASDFPELDDGKRVSWTMEYCTIVKQVPTPSKTVIGAMKKEIENSKAFLDALKKAKDKNPVCKVKPKITAQSKGIAGYKGIFPTMEEADASDKHIRILPAMDGHVYEIRCTEAGKFITRAENVRELSEINAGFVPAFPPVPFSLFAQVLAFFRHYMQKGHETEVMVYIYWDKELEEYLIRVPVQRVSKAHIDVIIPPDETIDSDRYIHVADIHSHNSMPAFFSGTDDRDELATRVYIVVGHINRSAPEIRARISVGGRFVPIDIRQVIDIPSTIITSSMTDGDINPEYITELIEFSDYPDFPLEWLSAVSVGKSGVTKSEASWFYPELPPRDKNFWLQCFESLRRWQYRLGHFDDKGV